MSDALPILEARLTKQAKLVATSPATRLGGEPTDLGPTFFSGSLGRSRSEIRVKVHGVVDRIMGALGYLGNSGDPG